MKEAGIRIHLRNLHNLMLEVFKTLSCLSPSYFRDMFSVKQLGYNLRAKNFVMLPQIKTQTFGANAITFIGGILWDALTDNITAYTNVAAFKKKVVGWKGENCNCRFCR